AKRYVREGLTGDEKVLVDPVKLSAPGEAAHVINYYGASFDGAYVAYGASPGGSEDAVIHVIETATGHETGETMDRGWFGNPSWLPDHRSFFHNRMQKMDPGMPPTERALKSKVYVHVVGTDPDSDPLVFGYEVSPRVKIEPADIPFIVTYPGSPYAFGVVAHGVENEITLYMAPLTSVGKPDTPWQKVCDVEDDVVDFTPRDVEFEEVKAKSYDGTLVPLSIVHRRGVALDGSHPTLLYGYGAYGITLDPFFDPKWLAWIERGGVYAVAHVRGGGEYGEDWHVAGKLLTKPNTWRDFIACGEYLIEHKYTAVARLAGVGGSAGGITIGRGITDRPDLFAAALDEVGMSDVVRVELSPNGPPNIPEFGSTKTPDGFKGVYEMRAYHHVTDGTAYPAVLLTTGITDPRVTPWQPAKLAARLQAATSSGKPILLRVDYEAGHG